MATESAPPSKRPSPVLLALLGLAIVAWVAMKLMGSATPTVPASNPRTAPPPAVLQDKTDAPAATRRRVDSSELDVHLEVLEVARPGATEVARNPFRFRPPPPPPPPVSSKPVGPAPPPVPVGPPPPPPPPPITVKFIGGFDLADGSKIANFTDCSVGRRQSQAREGGVVDGRYRLVKIGNESVIIEHLDGRGRTTLAKTGQECVK